MQNLKLISVRIDPIIIERIDNFIAKNPYWTRNFIINQLLLGRIQTLTDVGLLNYIHSRLDRTYFNR